MNIQKRVSIVVPTYNQAGYFPVCLDTIWQQDYGDIEIILVNDGSTDRTVEAIQEFVQGVEKDEVSYASHFDEERNTVERVYHPRYAREGRRLKVIHHEENQGLGTTLNTGFRACTGEYCTYIASDDFFYPTMVSDCVRALETEDADFVYADMNIVDDTGRIIRKFNLPGYSFENCFCHWYLCGICKLYKRTLHDELGYYRKDLFAHDAEMFLRFAMNGKKLLHIDKVLAVSRYHGEDRQVNNHTPRNWNRLFEETKDLVRKARQFAKDRSLNEDLSFETGSASPLSRHPGD